MLHFIFALGGFAVGAATAAVLFHLRLAANWWTATAYYRRIYPRAW